MIKMWRNLLFSEQEFANVLRNPWIDSQPGADTTTLLDVPACQATYLRWRNRFLESLNVYKAIGISFVGRIRIRFCWEVKSKKKRLILSSNRYWIMETTRWKTIRWTWARICKRLRSPGFDFKKSIQPAFVARRAWSSNKVSIQARQVGNRFLGSLKVLQIRALEMEEQRNRQSMDHRVHRVATATF